VADGSFMKKIDGRIIAQIGQNFGRFFGLWIKYLNDEATSETVKLKGGARQAETDKCKWGLHDVFPRPGFSGLNELVQRLVGGT
jgi:hypothetical protein